MNHVEIAGVQVPVYTGKNPIVFPSNLVITPTVERTLQNILYPLIEGKPILLIGDAGVGKNALVYYINYKRNFPTIRFSFNEDTLPEDLIGSYRLLFSGDGFEWVNGPMIRAMEEGASFVADEMNLASVSVLKRFATVYESNYLELYEGDGHRVFAKEGFHFIATQNPSEGFEGRKTLPYEITKNFAVIYVDPYPPDEIYFILKQLFPELVESLIRAVIRITLETEQRILTGKLGKSDLEKYHFNIRTLKKVCARLSHYDANDSHVILSHLKDIYVDSFRNEEDKKSQWDLICSEISFAKEYKPREVKFFINENTFYCNDKQLQVQKPESLKNLLSQTPLTKEIREFLEKIATCIEMKENILIEYSEEDDPLLFMDLITQLNGNKVEFVNLCKGIHTSDILGALKPIQKKEIAWIDGPLTRGIRTGANIAITSLEAAGAELVEKLNMLTDDARALLLPPESGENAPLTLKPNSIIFAFKGFRKSKSVSTISRAFRNRFTSILFPQIITKDSLLELVEFYLPKSNLTEIMVNFHLKIRELSHRRVIGSANLNPYIFGITNLINWTKHILKYNAPNVQEIVLRGAKISYINQIYDSKERLDVTRVLENALKTGELSFEIFKEIEEKKKTFTISSDIDKKRWWEPALHYREPNTGKTKLKMSGNSLKKGIEINTPETGGNQKEGPDAWYGSETRGNMGQGEPAGGGGAWGYRTEELYKQFLAKRKILWAYSMVVTKKEFLDIFGKELEDTELNLEKLFQPEIDVTRHYDLLGRRIDARKYISFTQGKGDLKVFDKTVIDKKDEKLKGVEVVFLVCKARRIFNFEYAIVVLSAMLSSAMILADHQVDFSVYTYSDRFNKKDWIDLVQLKKFEEEYTEEVENTIFQNLASDWQGDSVHEYLLLENIESYFTKESTTRILVMISDFRGQRGKASIQAELDSFENRRLKEVIQKNTNKSYILLGVGMGSRALAENLFPHAIQITPENFSHMPNLLGSELSRLILTYHT